MMICFCYFYWKKLFSILAMAHNDPFFVKIGRKTTILRGFANFFSELLDCNTSYLY